MIHKYVITEHLAGISGGYQKTVWKTDYKDAALHAFRQFCEENPESYLELREITHTEKCLAFTPMGDDAGKRDQSKPIVYDAETTNEN